MNKAGLVGDSLCQGKNNIISYGFILALKVKYCLAINEFGIIVEDKTFKGFNDCKRLLDSSQNFKNLEGEKIIAMLPKNWKKRLIVEL